MLLEEYKDHEDKDEVSETMSAENGQTQMVPCPATKVFCTCWFNIALVIGSVSVLKCFAMAGLLLVLMLGSVQYSVTWVVCICWFNTGLVNEN